MEKYILIKKESQSLYAELAISPKILSSATEVELIYNEVAEWVKNLTSGDINLTSRDINLTLEDFKKSEKFPFLKNREGKNYIVKTYHRINTKESIVKIFRKENSYTIIHK